MSDRTELNGKDETVSETAEKSLPELVETHIRETSKLLDALALGVRGEGVVVGFERVGDKHFVKVELIDGNFYGPGMGEAVALIRNPVIRHRNSLYG